MPPRTIGDIFGLGFGQVPTDEELASETWRQRGRVTAEELYPALAPLIKKIKDKNPKVTDEQLIKDLNEVETNIKKNLPEGITPEAVDVEGFGRKPNVLQRILAPAFEQVVNPVMRAVGLPGVTPPEMAKRAEYMGGPLPFIGRMAGDIPLIAATGGLGKLAGLGRPLLTDIIAGGAFGAASPILRGEEPTIGGVVENAAAFGGLGALGRKFFPGAMGARRGLPNEPVIQPGTRGPLHPEAELTSPTLNREALLGRPGFEAVESGALPPLSPLSEATSLPGGMPLRHMGPPAINAEATSVAPIEAGFEVVQPKQFRSVLGNPENPLVASHIAASGTELGIASEVEKMIGKLAAPKLSDKIDLLRTKRELAEAGIIPSIKPSEIAEEAVLRARDAVSQLGTTRADISDIAESLAFVNPKGKFKPTFTNQAERDAEMIRYFREGGEHHGITQLHMGFDPFEQVKNLKEMWQHWNTPASQETLANLRDKARGTFASKWRLPEVIFNNSRMADDYSKAFWGQMVSGRDAVEYDLIKFRNVLLDGLKPIIRNDKKLNEWMIATNSAEGYAAATPEIKAITDKLRETYWDPLYNLIAASEQKLGRDKPGYIKDYFTHVLDRTKTYTFLKDELKAAEAAGDAGKVEALREMTKHFVENKGRHYLSDQELGEAGKMVLKDLFNPTPATKTPLGAIKERSANLETFLTRDPVALAEGYAAGILRKLHYDPLLEPMSKNVAKMTADMRDRAISLIRDTLGIKHPSVTKWEGMLENIGIKLNDLMGNKTDPEYFSTVANVQNLSRMVRSFEYMRTMYGNIGGAMVNLTQLPLMSFPALAQKYGGTEAAKALMEATILAFQPNGKALARQMGAYRTRTAAGLEGQPHMLERLPELLDLFGMTETRLNRPISGIAQYLLARKGVGTNKQLTHDEAIREGIKFIRQTQFMVEPTTIPEVFRGPMGRIAYQYQSYKQQALNFFLNSLDAKGKAYFGATLLAIGGPTALPLIGPSLGAWLAENVSPAAGSGLPGALGLDLGQRMNILPSVTGANPQEVTGRTLQQTLGPAVSGASALIQSLWRAAKYTPTTYNGKVDMSTISRAVLEPVLRELEPVGLQRIAAGLEVAKTGELRAGQPSGTKMLLNAAGIPSEGIPARFGGYQKITTGPPRPAMEFMVGQGVPTIERTLYQRVADKAAQLKEINALQRDRIIEGYLYFKQSGDNSALVEAMRAAPGADLREILKQVEMSPDTRFRQQTPKRMRGELLPMGKFSW